MKKFLFLLLVLFVSVSCTDNQRARKWGGKEEVFLNPNEKFINITWKGNDLWVITKDTVTGVYYAREKSSFGILQGEIKISKKVVQYMGT
jgi:hypothetical protein